VSRVYPDSYSAPSPNFTSGRPWGPPRYIVEHWTVGSAHSVEVTFQNPDAKVSAHFMVTREGYVVQFVELDDTAWHSGTAGFNYLGIGIEHEHIPEQDWPEAQLRASAALHRWLAQEFGIPLIHVDADASAGVLGHRETGYATACPGDLPIDRLIGGDMAFTKEQYAAELEDFVKDTVRVIVQNEVLPPLAKDIEARIASATAAQLHTHTPQPIDTAAIVAAAVKAVADKLTKP